MIENFKKALILAPHTDDGELGCGGTIAKMLEAGCEVHYVAFSDCKISVPSPFPQDILRKELFSAMQSLGIGNEQVSILDFNVRTFANRRQDILDEMILLKQRIQPDIVFCPATHDIHQDHQTIAEEAQRAFKFSTLLGYELPWNTSSFNIGAFVKLQENHLKAKKAAIDCYESQKGRTYTDGTVIESLARVRGVQAGTLFAEAFEMIRINL